MYNLLTVGAMADVGEFLAELFRVAPGDVDVSVDTEYEDRNWDASVSCEYAETHGDLHRSLSVYVAESVSEEPSEETVALEMARWLGAPVLFPGAETVPTVWRVATAGGQVTHARVIEPEDESGSTRVTEVEVPVPEFPESVVTGFPDIIKEVQLPTPVVDAWATAQTVEGERRTLRGLLVNWERLTVRMDEGWPPSHWYPSDLYVDDLRLRDQVESRVGQLSEKDRSAVERVLTELDALYRERTVDDGGTALARACEISQNELSGRPWYWRRRPAPLPWESAPAARIAS
ncbi:hypothetical protein AN216_11120 [Streptomyces oceani]|uniref:Uncharacterized protein n=2 Tax=Streptomyces oceani TaxID=1075402 RepID=A0A1E7KHR2_9ACTN|nr:hypothetical protein AN216_11120 [Streptomyces oceani]